MSKRHTLKTLAAAAALALAGIAPQAVAQESLKIGLILPMTGPFASTGRQIDAAIKLYMARHGDKVWEEKIILKQSADVATLRWQHEKVDAVQFDLASGGEGRGQLTADERQQ